MIPSATVTFDAMFVGFEEAVSRLRIAVEAQRPIQAFTAVFEALNWASSIDERVGEEWSPSGHALGRSWRAQVEEAGILAGIRFARNRSQHQWANALVLPEDEAFPVWTWRAAAELPQGRPDPSGEAVYRQSLEGRPVQPELDVLWLVFTTVRTSMRTEPGSPVLGRS